ncbi:MAG: NADH-quinone oxidoreductase subunit H [Planctomycetes bacterium]|nr:NADH-quinone oxidoreductase subunit H [Planctomycetota bacterium]
MHPVLASATESTDWTFLLGIVHVALVGAFFGLPAGVFIWAERKVSGRIQDRLGPTRTGGRFGWLQSAADGAKLIQKEDLAPEAADKFLFRLAPYIVVVASFCAFMFLPFADGWSAVSADVGLFMMLAMLSLEVIGVIFAGWSSGSKWALFGAIREAAQMISYEIPMAICGLVPIVLLGTLNLNEIVHFQVADGGLLHLNFLNWMVFHPIAGPAFMCYFVCATASCKRAPFDLAEAESELVAGFLTEYSGMRWSFFFLAEYASMFAVSGIAAILFLGGWDDGLGIQTWLRGTGTMGAFTANLLGAVVLIKKASVLVFLQIWVRWTLPRLRIDQVMTTCLKYLIPISCTLFLAAILTPLALISLTGRPELPWVDARGERAGVESANDQIFHSKSNADQASEAGDETAMLEGDE